MLLGDSDDAEKGRRMTKIADDSACSCRSMALVWEGLESRQYFGTRGPVWEGLGCRV